MSYKINETITFEPNGDNGFKLKNDNHQRLYYNVITVDSIIYNILKFHIWAIDIGDNRYT